MNFIVLAYVEQSSLKLIEFLYFSTKQFGPGLKLVLCICIPIFVIAWPPIGIACTVVGGAAYGLLAPMFATFQAIEEGKTDKFYHCFIVSETLEVDEIVLV